MSPWTSASSNSYPLSAALAQGTDRHAFHLAEVLQMALREGPAGTPGGYPETAMVRQREAEVRKSMKKFGLTAVGLAAGAALLWSVARKRS